MFDKIKYVLAQTPCSNVHITPVTPHSSYQYNILSHNNITEFISWLLSDEDQNHFKAIKHSEYSLMPHFYNISHKNIFF